MTESKWLELNKLNPGDEVRLTNGNIVSFQRLKRTNFLGDMNGKTYDISVSMFVEVVSKVDIAAVEKEREHGINSLEKGELFYINQNGKSLLFKFNHTTGSKIIADTIDNKSKATIDLSLYGGKVADLCK